MKYKVDVPCRAIRSMAWEMGHSRYWKCVFAMLFCTLLSKGPVYIVSEITDNEVAFNAASLICFLLGVGLKLGLAKFFLKIFRGQYANLDDITSGISFLPVAVVAELITSIKVSLWSCLLFIPGIICAIRYCFRYFVISDNPDAGPFEALLKTRIIMDGNKAKFARFCLSYIGWFALASLPLIIYSYINPPSMPVFFINPEMSAAEMYAVLDSITLSFNQFLSSPAVTLLGLLTVLPETYFMMGSCCFYDFAAGNLIVSSDLPSEEVLE